MQSTSTNGDCSLLKTRDAVCSPVADRQCFVGLHCANGYTWGCLHCGADEMAVILVVFRMQWGFVLVPIGNW